MRGRLAGVTMSIMAAQGMEITNVYYPEMVLYHLIGNIGRPKSFRRFLIQAESCITHNAYAALPRITCPTLVIGGTRDRIVTGTASIETADRIPESRLKMYEGLSHGLYEEAPDFLKQVIDFCR